MLPTEMKRALAPLLMQSAVLGHIVDELQQKDPQQAAYMRKILTSLYEKAKVIAFLAMSGVERCADPR